MDYKNVSVEGFRYIRSKLIGVLSLHFNDSTKD